MKYADAIVLSGSYRIFYIEAVLTQYGEIIMEELNLTKEWDKVFPKSEKVNHDKVTFHNRYGITLAADLYIPKNASGKLPAVAVCGPFVR